MEILLAIVVASAVIFFGALISMGNDRQRKAIDGLREQVGLWAVQDIQIKREKLKQEISIDDPISWFNKIVYKISRRQINLRIVEIINDNSTLIFSSEESQNRIVFSTNSPNDLKSLRRDKKSRLSNNMENQLVSLLSKQVTAYEISALNGGIMFDLELSLAWSMMTAQKGIILNKIWMYID